MSTGADCVFLVVDGKWYYMLQRWPYGEWPKYEAHGPFGSKEDGYRHLRWSYANPGSSRTFMPGNLGYREWKAKLEAELEEGA
jgi:hypothetical protein